MNFMLGALALLSSILSPSQERPGYAAGQVWEYAGRPEDAGSLIKIHQVEASPTGPIYHIGMTGIRVTRDRPPTDVHHLPVSRETLDASVTRLASPQAAARPFTDPSEGIAIWRENEGGVFTIPLVEIAEILVSQMTDRPSENESRVKQPGA
ncbi:MAG: hypothetical protein KYX69_08305 [Sphingomonas sp.]|jgi:hypothetical protein|uniref:hypothetical protein n=1 Tax=Sphingomonas sp. TaxID=28214 RepID=UPI0026074279|nr:hypothetical protein [Sphingomonas sp.]MDK2767707.1 hypothetical protein [Sphingomonas sp.]